MRTKTRPVGRPPRRLKVDSVRGEGEVVQVLHPSGADLDTADAARLLRQVSRRCHAENKLLLTGAGFVTLLVAESAWSRAQLREKAGLAKVRAAAQQQAQKLARLLADLSHDVVVGIDVLVGRGPWCAGQFAAWLCKGRCRLAWKSYPAGGEDYFLAGLDCDEVLDSPRVLKTRLGKTSLLVCHDAQAFNPRSKATRGLHTRRHHLSIGMQDSMRQRRPVMALNLIHAIHEPLSVGPFMNSYNTLRGDFGTLRGVVGAFGYSPGVKKELEALAAKLRSPPTLLSAVAIIE